MRRLALGVAATAAATALMVPSALASPESDAADAINQAWQAAGGASSAVGAKEGDVYEVGDGFGQKFSQGKIFFSPDTGAHIMYGAILNKYESLGGPADSDLDFPNIDEVTGLVGPSSRVSTFSASDKPAIFWTPDTGAWAVRGAINAAWDKLGGSAGTLGVPIAEESYDGDVVSQKFSGGQLSWNSKTNTFTSDPAGLADRLAGLEVPLDPTSMINFAWRASGGLGGPLGARQGKPTMIGDNGASQGYASGKIFYSPQTGAHAVTGAILSKYESLGGPTGDLGYPAGPEADGGVPNSRVSTFSAADNPAIFWTPDTGAVVVRGPIHAAWEKLGAATGKLGVPTNEQTAKGDVITQTFTGGDLSWNRATKEFTSKPSNLASELSGLQMPDAVAKTPAAPASTTSEESGWRWWWLAILLPALLLLGLLAMLAQRKSRPAGPDIVADRRDYFANEPEDLWPGTRPTREPVYDDPERDLGYWSTQRVEEPTAAAPDFGSDSGFDSDEDAIDTAPTRVPSEAELGDSYEPASYEQAAYEPASYEPAGDYGELFGGPSADTTGRHSVNAIGSSMAAWRLELDDVISASRHRRHAADEPWTEEIAVVVPDHMEQASEQAQQGWHEPEAPRAEAVDDTWRPAIHLPLADPFQAPEGYWIKGSTHSGLYYTPDSILYDNTLPEVWFASEELAQANGFVKAPE